MNFPHYSFRPKDPEELLQLLVYVQNKACKKNHRLLLSINIEISYLEPLAVLQSIEEAGKSHFYWKDPWSSCSVATSDHVWQVKTDGQNRFLNLQNVLERELYPYVITSGEVVPKDCGFSVYTHYNFEPVVTDVMQSPFPSAQVTIPRWQICAKAHRYFTTANLWIDSNTDLEEATLQLWLARKRFEVFEYADLVENLSDHPNLKFVKESFSPEGYQNQIKKALDQIRFGSYQKVVVSRYQQWTTSKDWPVLALVNKLRFQFPNCYTYSIGDSFGNHFIGATPESLFEIQGDQLRTASLAGTAIRSRSASKDAKLGKSLLQSSKNLSEQNWVTQMICEKLEDLGLTTQTEKKPRLLQLANLQHLKTEISAKISSQISPFVILQNLHPTAALGGYPQEKAISYLYDLEQYERGLYGGGFGRIFPDGDSHFLVLIRGAQIHKNTVRFCAGGGVVAGSEPEEEYQETENKLEAIRKVFGI